MGEITDVAATGSRGFPFLFPFLFSRERTPLAEH